MLFPTIINYTLMTKFNKDWNVITQNKLDKLSSKYLLHKIIILENQ
jgi:hypothetical protein